MEKLQNSYEYYSIFPWNLPHFYFFLMCISFKHILLNVYIFTPIFLCSTKDLQSFRPKTYAHTSLQNVYFDVEKHI